MLRQLTAIALCLGIGGCANTVAMRDLAEQTGSKVDDYQTSLNDFIAAQNALNAGNQEELAVFADLTASEKSDAQRQFESWQFANRPDLMSQMTLAMRRAPADISLSPDLQPPPLDRVSDGGAASVLSAGSGQLHGLASRGVTWMQMLGDAKPVADAVIKSLTKIKEDAAAASHSPPTSTD